MEMIIYLMTNLINGKIYVGKSIHNDLNYTGSGILIERAVKKNGKKNFKKEILQECSTEKELNDKEKYWIKELDATNPEIGYNIAEGGQGGITYIRTSEHNRNHAEWMKGRYCGKDNWMWGRTGELSPNWGKKSSRARSVTINNKYYSTIKEAIIESSVCKDTIYYRLRTEKPGYSYYKEETQIEEEYRRKINKKIASSNKGKIHTKEQNRNHGEWMKGRFCDENSPNARAVKINGVIYPAVTVASRELNTSYDILQYRFATGKEGYSFVGDTPEDIAARRMKNTGDKNKNHNAKPVIINGKFYLSIMAACRELSITYHMLSKWLHEGKEGYSYFYEEDIKDGIETRKSY